MFDLLIDAFNQVILFFADLVNYLERFWDFLQHGIYDFFTKLLATWIIYSTIATIKFKLWSLTFAWHIAQQILSQLNIVSAIESAWGSVDSRIMSAMSFFRIPEAINIILTARLTRFVLKFMGL